MLQGMSRDPIFQENKKLGKGKNVQWDLKLLSFNELETIFMFVYGQNWEQTHHLPSKTDRLVSLLSGGHNQLTHSSILLSDFECRKLSQPGQLCRLSWIYMSQSRQKNCLHFGQETQGAGMFPATPQAHHR